MSNNRAPIGGKVRMPDLLSIYAEAQPDKPAVVDDRGGGDVVCWTYAELEAEANRLADALASVGVTPGDKVVWCGPNSRQVVAVVNAARKAGGVAVPLNYRLTPEEALYVIGNSDASIAYVDAEYAPMFARLGDGVAKVGQVIVDGGGPPAGMLGEDFVAAESPDPPQEDDAEEGAAATMIYTSGTTGKPKGALRRGRPGDAAVVGLLGLIGYTPDDIYLTSGPLYHSGPGGVMGGALALVQTIGVQRKLHPEDWVRPGGAYPGSSTLSAPTLIRMVCSLPPEVKAR